MFIGIFDNRSTKKTWGFPYFIKISLIMRVVEQVDSVRFQMTSELEARHSITEYLVVADSKMIGADDWNFIVAGMSLLLLLLVTNMKALGELLEKKQP